MSHDVEDEVLAIFYDESKEHLETIEDDLLTLESQGENIDDDLVNSIFRAVHTIKGGCGFFGLTELSSLSHVMENLLDRIRKHEMKSNPDVISTLLKGADLLKIMIDEPERTEDLDLEPVILSIQSILDGTFNEKEQEAHADTVDIFLPNGRVIFTINRYEFERARNTDKGGLQVYLIEYDLIHDIERKNKTPWDVISELLQLATFIDSKVDLDAVGSLDQEGEISALIPFYILISTVIETDLIYDFLDLPESRVHLISDANGMTERYIESQAEEYSMKMAERGLEAPELPPIRQDEPGIPEMLSAMESNNSTAIETPSNLEDKASTSIVAQEASNVVTQVKESPKPVATSRAEKADSPAKGEPKKGDGSIRVNVNLLDKLMSLAGELVLTRNELIQNTQTQNWEAVTNTSQQVDLITAELQEAIMATRMQSIGLVFHKFNRVVRDLSKALGKDVKLVLEGEEVELDKTIIESIGDPLTHIVRNSLDHGFELPQERIDAGKPAYGTLKISAFHEGGCVVIEIVDDGLGVNLDRVREKAFQNGLATKEQLDAMGEKETTMLIFKPGFSTAEQVTDISGRGVGMDVVMTNLTKLGGTIDVDSVFGKGTRIKIKLPLTLAIIPSLLVSVGTERFAIPQVNLIELVRVSSTSLDTKIESVGETMMMRLRGRLLPLIDLCKVIGQPRSEEDELETVNIAVVLAGEVSYGLIVDELLDSSEIVVKPLGRHIQQCSEYAGATILGDGQVALILDVGGICTKMELLASQAESDTSKSTTIDEQENDGSDGGDKQTLLLVHNAENEPFAIPLGLVARIEKIATSSIETVSGRKAIKYRGDTLSLFSLEEVANVSPRLDSEFLYVVVFKISGREVGLMLSEINDIVENYSAIDDVTYRQPGIFGSLIISDRITLIIDIYGLIYSLMPQWLEKVVDTVQTKNCDVDRKPCVLIAEDSRFFMSQLVHFMEEAGYDVLTAEDGAIALETLQNNKDVVDLILTDIEMPNMDGLEFTERVREEQSFKALPILAVTSIAGDEAAEKGLNVGLDEYLIKLDRDEIVERSSHYLKHGRSL